MQLNDTFTETYNPIRQDSNQIPKLKRKATTPILALLHTPTINIPLPFHPSHPTNINLDCTKNRKNMVETQQATKADAAA
jgi:hypothetical protein